MSSLFRRDARGVQAIVLALMTTWCASAQAASYTAHGFVSAGFTFPGSPGPILNEPYFMTGGPNTGGSRRINDQGQTIEHTSLHAQADSLADRGLLRSHTFAQMIRSQGGTGTPTGFGVNASATAEMTFTDILVTGPGSIASAQLNLDLHGNFLNGTTFVSDGFTFANNNVGVSVFVNNTFVGAGDYSYGSMNGSTPAEISSAGMLAGFDGSAVLQTNVFSLPLNTPVSLRIVLQTGASVSGPLERGLNLSANTDFGSTLTLATSGPVFSFAGEGFTANSVEAGIVDNTFAVPEPAAALPLLVAGLLALRRRR